ncbi:hypothetical protein OC846_006550 [Tilletia horrida]|uniref:JmjC domain-containing protein n=1 Tax=Tilletia horrida TaxID=155126 RepID=A0AAN6GLF0_9BASI|nr:hypothetical protein OC846_006550 [Tilletia horrida]KAK0543262.1 hypothetical protein OC845_006207 [Tilletia horrida]
MVLQYLSDSGIPCLEPLKTDIHDSFKIEPNVLHLEQDLRANQDFGIIATGTGTGAPHLSPAHLSASFRAIDASTLMGFAPAQLCAGNNIFPTAEGLKKCGPCHAPWRQQYGHHPSQRLEASTAYCPRGHITDVHQDSLFEGRFTTVLLGRKLFLTWPPTGHNLAIYNEVHGHFTGFVLPSVLRRLQGLQVTLHSHGSVNFMPPGTIHSVLNLDSAATFAYDVVHINMAKDILRLCQWEQEVSRKLIASGDKTDTVASIADEHKDGVSRWTHFARASTDPEVLVPIISIATLSSSTFLHSTITHEASIFITTEPSPKLLNMPQKYHTKPMSKIWALFDKIPDASRTPKEDIALIIRHANKKMNSHLRFPIRDPTMPTLPVVIQLLRGSWARSPDKLAARMDLLGRMLQHDGTGIPSNKGHIEGTISNNNILHLVSAGVYFRIDPYGPTRMVYGTAILLDFDRRDPFLAEGPFPSNKVKAQVLVGGSDIIPLREPLHERRLLTLEMSSFLSLKAFPFSVPDLSQH